MRFQGRVALVTGGNSGIGLACAQRLAAEGARVVVACRNVATGEQAVSTIQAAGGAARAVRMDVTRPDEVTAALASVVAVEGALHVLIHSAGGGGELQAATEIDEAQWSTLLDVNLGGAWRVSRAALPVLARSGGGAVVLISSIAALDTVPRAAPYMAGKSGMLGLTRSMALDYAVHGVRVNCVCPAFVETPLLSRVIESQPDARKARLAWTRLHPLGRLGRPDDVAAAATFLAAPEAGWITGVALPVDGGYLLGRVAGAPPDLSGS
ncbi:MAG: SDR family oxidoreductase [Myxococcota bacterium]